MSQILTGTKELPGLRKTFLNLMLFLISVVIVTAILTWGKNPERHVFTGTLVVVISCYMVLYLFILQFRREVLHVTRKVFFILLAIIAFVGITRVVTNQPGKNLELIIPIAIVPIVIRTFYDARLALFILLITTLLSGFMVPDPFSFVIISFVTGMAAIFTLKKIYRKSRLFFTSAIVVITYATIWTGVNLMQHGSLPQECSVCLFYILGNGALVLVSFPLIFLFEQNFLLLSETTLLELTDTNLPLLRKLAEDAPGSFQHSLQVANLAEEAARAIGANSMLARAGSMYHDIGKIANPKYFIENQGDDVSLHLNLEPRESARVIISHVRNGVNLAKNYKLPVQIIDFIRMHHGTTVAFFFYKKYIDMHPEEKNIGHLFTYPGPKPFSKETAVVMMADAVEASSRTLSSHSEESISELVERIIFLQEQDGQFTDVPLTFRDMSEIKKVFCKRLANIYHARVVYPERI